MSDKIATMLNYHYPSLDCLCYVYFPSFDDISLLNKPKPAPAVLSFLKDAALQLEVTIYVKFSMSFTYVLCLGFHLFVCLVYKKYFLSMAYTAYATTLTSLPKSA
jgi:hypothetical protein